MVFSLIPIFIAAVVFLAVIAAVVVIVITVTKSKSHNHPSEFNTYKAMANNLTLSNQEIREELSELKEKIGSIERMLKEVE